MTATADEPLIFLVAGEPSGDMLGGRLMAALKELTDGRVRFAGVGGGRMAAEGLDSLFPMSELSVMGYLEVVPRIPRLLVRIRETAAAARRLRPAVVVTIDSPDFNFRVARRLAGSGIPVAHYVAPQVWAHRPGRVTAIARILDHVLALFPFEPPLFEAAGLACNFVGHPIVEEGAGEGDGPAFRARHGIAAEAPLVCLLPGSRHGEVARLLPVFGAAASLLSAERTGLGFVVPAAPAVHAEVAAGVAGWPVDALIVSGREEKYDAFAAADVTLAASGTVALELAIAGLPGVIAYKVNPLTAWLARRMIRVPHVSLVNLILDRPAVPELLQENCRPDLLAAAIARLLDDGEARVRQTADLSEAALALGLDGPPPSRRAAEIVLDLAARANSSG